MVRILSVARIFLGCLPPHCFSWYASHWALGPRPLSQQCVPSLSSSLVDLVVLRICILSAVDKDVVYQGDFFVGPKNILHRTLEQLAEAYCVLKHAVMNAKPGSTPVLQYCKSTTCSNRSKDVVLSRCKSYVLSRFVKLARLCYRCASKLLFRDRITHLRRQAVCTYMTYCFSLMTR